MTTPGTLRQVRCDMGGGGGGHRAVYGLLIHALHPAVCRGQTHDHARHATPGAL